MLSARLKIYAKAETANSLGEIELTRSLFKSVWAQEMHIKMEEVEKNQSIKPMDQYKFKLRYNTWLSEDHEIDYDGGTMSIESIEPAGHQLKQWLIVRAVRSS